jgi:protein-S-isoprenylcysteine O-methyltransferase Ste14
MSAALKAFAPQFLSVFVAFAACLFLSAGSLTWLTGWLFLALFMGFYLGVSLWLARHNPGLFQERLHLRAANQQGWDRLVFPLMLGAYFAWLALCAWDGARAHWLPLPAWAPAVGLALLLLSFYLLFLTFRENSYLSPVVRVQSDRGHRVIDTGPYHLVRHPMYSGIALFTFGTALLLGSGVGALAGLLPLLVLARRAVLEERMLRANLPGYTAYTAAVRYRLIPYVW